MVTYMVEQPFVNAADTVAENTAKSQLTLTFDAATDGTRRRGVRTMA